MRGGLHSQAVAATILIAPPERLPALQKRDDLRKAIAFADTDALRALEVIARRRPGVVAIEREFAAASRGAALIERIKADPALTACEIRVVAHDSDDTLVSPPRAEKAGAVPTTAAPDPAIAKAPPVVAPLDQRGTRRAPRFNIVDGVEAQIDSRTTTLVNLSVIGAQVVSPTVLKPNQRVRFTLGSTAQPIRCRAVVAWASFEIPKGASHYRAGLELSDADQASLTSFIEANKK